MDSQRIKHLVDPGEEPLERVGSHLLETLDALATVYDSAAEFAAVAACQNVADATLDRCLHAVGCAVGAIYLEGEDGLSLQADRGDAASKLAPAALELVGRDQGAMFRNAEQAAPYLVPDAGCSILTAPIVATAGRLGWVVIMAEGGAGFSTGDVKLVAAVTSQAAIALSSAHHYRDVELERSKLRLVIEQNSDGIVVALWDGRIVLCNSQARRLLDMPEEGSVGADLFAILSEWQFPSSDSVFGSGEEAVEACKGSGHAQRVVGIRSREVMDADGAVVNVILTLYDLTEKRREERLKKDFLSLISHKFRTPLTVVLGSLAMLEDEALDGRGEVLREATERAEEIGVLLDRLLYFSEVMEGSWSTRGSADLLEFEEPIGEHFRRHYGSHGVVLEWDIAADARRVSLPASRVRVVLDNLIDNAIKFSLPAAPRVFVRSRRGSDGALELTVEDRGPGIAAEERQRVFQSFYQRDEDFTGQVRGAGIGLAIVTEIVRRVGGRIRIDDAAPQGTAFVLTLPYPERAAQA